MKILIAGHSVEIRGRLLIYNREPTINTSLKEIELKTLNKMEINTKPIIFVDYSWKSN